LFLFFLNDHSSFSFYAYLYINLVFQNYYLIHCQNIPNYFICMRKYKSKDIFVRFFKTLIHSRNDNLKIFLGVPKTLLDNLGLSRVWVKIIWRSHLFFRLDQLLQGLVVTTTNLPSVWPLTIIHTNHYREIS
jgi:hypothetical protein